MKGAQSLTTISRNVETTSLIVESIVFLHSQLCVILVES